MAEPFDVVILAAQRDGMLDPLAEQAGVTHKCLVPILGRPLLEYVIEALVAVPGLRGIRICVEPGAEAALRSIRCADGESVPVDYVPSKATIPDSVYAATEGLTGPIVFTTADNVNLTPGAVAQMLAAIADGGQVALAMTTKAAVLAAHPQGQRNFYVLRDDAYANCNLYALADKAALKVAETFRGGGQFARNRRRLIEAFGLFNVVMFRYGLFTLPGAMRRLSRRFGADIRAVVLADGAHAVDVDNQRTYAIAETILMGKAAERPASTISSPSERTNGMSDRTHLR